MHSWFPFLAKLCRTLNVKKKILTHNEIYLSSPEREYFINTLQKSSQKKMGLLSVIKWYLFTSLFRTRRVRSMQISSQKYLIEIKLFWLAIYITCYIWTRAEIHYAATFEAGKELALNSDFQCTIDSKDTSVFSLAQTLTNLRLLMNKIFSSNKLQVRPSLFVMWKIALQLRDFYLYSHVLFLL